MERRKFYSVFVCLIVILLALWLSSAEQEPLCSRDCSDGCNEHFCKPCGFYDSGTIHTNREGLGWLDNWMLFFIILISLCCNEPVPENAHFTEESVGVWIQMITIIFLLVVISAIPALLWYTSLIKKSSPKQKVSKKIDDRGPPHDARHEWDGRSVSKALPLELMVRLRKTPGQVILMPKKNKDDRHLLGLDDPLISHCFEFRRGQEFKQSVTACPVGLAFVSNFVSGSFEQPSTDRELQKEGVRLATFRDFPVSIPVSALRLAQAGFYYQGNRDEVKCFSCEKTHQNWQLGDKPAQVHARISPNCSLVRGSDTVNVPLPMPLTNLPNFADETSMESGYGSGLVEPDGNEQSRTVSDQGSADSGQLLTSTGSYAPDSVSSLPSSSTAASTLTNPSGSAPIPSSLATPENSMFSGAPVHGLATNMDGGAPRNLPLPSRRLDLAGAVYPLYSQLDARKRSFSTWTALAGLPDVEELVRLGFFYAGYADCVRCFFCGIGLKSWEREDIPAEVHAKWRPTCEYLRLVKGDVFVDTVVNGGRNVGENVNHQNDNARNQNSGNSQLARDSTQPQQAPSNSSDQQRPSPTVPDVPVVHRARQRGYTDQQIAEAIEKLRIIGMEGAMDVMLVDILTNLFTTNPLQRNNQPAPNAGTGNNPAPIILPSRRDTDMQQDGGDTGEEVADDAPAALDERALQERHNALQQENARLRDMRTCQQCHNRQVGVIFLPCGHIVACSVCAPDIRRCNRCDSVIRATANVFFS